MGTRLQWWLWHLGLALMLGVVVFITSLSASWIHHGLELSSPGRGGRAGGVGLDADLHSDRRNDEAARLPFRQFFRAPEVRHNRFYCMVIAVIAAVQYLSLQFLEPETMPVDFRQGLLLTTVIFVAATVIAFLVTPFHIPTGH